MTKRSAYIWFVLCAIAALGLYYLMFEFRYLWYVEVEQAALMRSIFAASIALIALLWAAYPSRIAVAMIAIVGLFFPHVLFDADARPLLGRTVDFAMIAMSAVPVLLLVVATQLRRNTKNAVP